MARFAAILGDEPRKPLHGIATMGKTLERQLIDTAVGKWLLGYLRAHAECPR
jgi:hypothetical protein